MGKIERQCAACRVKKAKEALIRIVRISGNGVKIDPLQKMNGRGVYLCPEPACISAARERDSISASLHVPVDSALYLDLAEMVSAKFPSSIKSLLGIAVKGGKAILGVEQVRAALKKNQIYAVILNPDISPASREKLIKICRHTGVSVVEYRDRQPMDLAVGRDNCRVAGIIDRKLADTILSSSTSK